MNSSLLESPCFAKESATMFDSRPLKIISIPGSRPIAFRMKLMMKLRFHGPFVEPLHHCTTLLESDSMMSLDWIRESIDLEILIALWIAWISAWLISIQGIGEENKHLKTPWLSRSTPPIADFDWVIFREASTFHLRVFRGGGTQRGGSTARRPICGLGGIQSRHSGFLRISLGVNGKGSPHPLIHHPNLNMTRSFRWERELAFFSKHRLFLSF